VVGPNGSGKSNVVDAVTWVLGAQGPRSLRSAKMEDVIFAGTSKRAALGRAEVTLTIDNSSGLIPIEFSEVTITRTLWRSGESEYAINGAPCRLLDVQELLSDTGVGRQQHVIVSQGQLDAVLNAQPTDRRLIVEEAAGVLKFRRRREKAQRRLESTEGNLLRVQDLLREVRRQLRPLERQADAARRHGDVVVELTALRLFLAGRELTGLRSRAASIAAVRNDQAAAERELVARLGRLDADVITAEAALMAAEGAEGSQRPLRDRLADEAARAEGLRERTRGLLALVAERKRSLDRLRMVEMDADLVSSLEGESASLVAALEDVERQAERLGPEFDDLLAAEGDAAAERTRFEADHTAPGPEPVESGHTGQLTPRPAGAAEIRGELAALRSAAERGGAERRRLEERGEARRDKVARLEAEAASLEGSVARLEEQGADLAAGAEAATRVRIEAEAALEAADGAVDAANGQHRAWAARAEALALALDQARARAGAERLAAVDGLVGTLLDVIEVDAGWGPSFEAAIGDALGAVVVAGVDAARSALAHLHAEGIGGAVLALGAAAGAPRSAESVAAVQQVCAARPGAQPVRAHVRSDDPAVDALLDRLLAVAVVVPGSWADALDVVLEHPGLVVVTQAGDRFADGGWRAGAGGAGATGAALDEARARATQAEAELATALSARGEARIVAAAARSAEAEALKALDRHATHRAQAGADLQRIERDRRDAEADADGAATHLAELVVRLQHDDARIAELAAALPVLEAEEAAGQERAQAERAARGRVEQREAALRALRTDLEVRAAGLEERRALLGRRRAEVEERLGRHRAEREAASRRRVELAGHVVAVERLARVLTARAEAVDGVLTRLREERQAHAARTAALTSGLDDLRRQRTATERDLAATRERLQRAELEDAEVRVRLESTTETVRRELDVEPDTAIATPCPPLPPGTTADHRARELERDLRLMGPINPLALEEHAALMERHTFLEAQLEDVKAGRRELAKVIRAIDGEIVDVFAAAYADVADNFATLFSMLFPGGTGRLRLTDPDNLLETGIEVEARPSGKNVKRLSLLSGGERSLTAMAFLFAVFRSRPSPFYLMDEVEAALDDVNLHRFLDLLREFRTDAQLLIVSHQKRTMEAADCLYGVTMQPAGSSRVISERIGAGAA